METGMDIGNSQSNSLNLTALFQTISGLSDSDKAALFKQIGIEHEDDLMCFIQSAECAGNNPILNKGYEEEMMQFEAFRLHKNLLLFIPPIMLIIGTIGNVLNFIILTRKSMRRLSTYTYLAVLSMTDILVLYIGLLRLWVGALTGKDVRDHAVWICKTINVLGYTVSDYSVWLIIAMTVERWIALLLLLCRGRAAHTNPNMRWQSEFSQGYTEKTALTPGGTANAHRMQVRSQHGPCRTKNCPLVSSATGMQRPKAEVSVPLNRITSDGKDIQPSSPVICRMEVKVKSCANGRLGVKTTSTMDYSRVQSGEV
ncbi:hypothetical protein CAPTEDRAFT_190678 [Capitella teleta]|uniref:G-protein coupled receptors family 1 profile domain-containing protein n=1 Tax=Capitella teleta TaxID=283909 RepID=R7TCR6_CAPTE|nr:hypothetical protein CAPTEDRAFT_190678 [Capitella teleta]|eukprot:ELT88866.1 hypothetical protein CAPTEDRAFT_190678 [Capitella teleta]